MRGWLPNLSLATKSQVQEFTGSYTRPTDKSTRRPYGKANISRLALCVRAACAFGSYKAQNCSTATEILSANDALRTSVLSRNVHVSREQWKPLPKLKPSALIG